MPDKGSEDLGFVKLDRCLLDKHIFQNEKLLKVWIWCLLKARHSPGEWGAGHKKIPLQPGQFIFGRATASLELSMKQSTLWGYMLTLKNNQSIDIKSNNKYSVVTVVNWGLYQVDKYKPDNNLNNNPTTTRQQLDTNKNVNKVKNVKKKEYSEFVRMTEVQYQTLVDKFGEQNTLRFVEKLDAFLGTKKKDPYTSHYHAILKWVVDAVLPKQQAQPRQFKELD